MTRISRKKFYLLNPNPGSGIQRPLVFCAGCGARKPAKKTPTIIHSHIITTTFFTVGTIFKRKTSSDKSLLTNHFPDNYYTVYRHIGTEKNKNRIAWIIIFDTNIPSHEYPIMHHVKEIFSFFLQCYSKALTCFLLSFMPTRFTMTIT